MKIYNYNKKNMVIVLLNSSEKLFNVLNHFIYFHIFSFINLQLLDA